VAKEKFNPLILSLGETIRLRVEGQGYVLLSSQLIIESFGEVRGELRVSVEDHLRWQFKPLVNVVVI
jgi:hypothetical protein